MDPVVEEFDKVKTQFEEAHKQILEYIKLIQEYGKSSRNLSTGEEDQEHQIKDSLPRLNGLAQDFLSSLQLLHTQLDFLAPQLPNDDQVQQAQHLTQSWGNKIHSLRNSYRQANLQAKENTIRTTKQERDLLLGAGEESTTRKRNLRTKAELTSAAENVTESLRRSYQMMVQEGERTANTLTTFEESTTVLGKAESEYKGHRSLLMRTRNLLSTMKRQDIMDRLIVAVGFLLFSLVVLYVVSKRIGLLTLQRKVMDAVKAGTVKDMEFLPRAARDVANLPPPRVNQDLIHMLDVPLEHHDEL